MLTMSLRRLGVAILPLVVAASASAQVTNPCPDGFTGACCASATPNLPVLPAVSWNDAKQTCWIDCGPFPNTIAPLGLTAPVQTGACGVYDAQLTGPLVSCATPPGSRLRLYYTRHWPQAFPTVGSVVVYRFVAVGNVCVAPQAGWSCAVEGPPATPFVFGFVDYAYRKIGPPPCNLQFVAAALAVGHPCDRFVHDASCPFMADPLPPTHPLDQYVLVAPGTNFTSNALLVPPSGPGLNTNREAIRLVQPSSTGTCTTNDVFSSLQLTNILQQCACVDPNMPNGPFWRQGLDSTTKCGSILQTSPLCPFSFSPPPMTSPFPTLVAWSIGKWGPGAFPGLPGPGNQFFLAQGSATFQRPGTAICPGANPQRGVYYGVENRWGSGGVGGKRVDLVDNVRQPAGGTVVPVVGGPAPLGTHVVFFY